MIYLNDIFKERLNYERKAKLMILMSTIILMIIIKMIYFAINFIIYSTKLNLKMMI